MDNYSDQKTDGQNNITHLTTEMKQALEFIETLFDKMQMKVINFSVQKETESEEEGFYCNLECDDKAMIIGKKGSGILAIQLILNSYLLKNQIFLKLFLDIGGYRKKQINYLREEIDNAVFKIRKYGKAILMKGPYSPFERKQIHLYVQKMEDLTSQSEGNSFLKSVWISKNSNIH